MPRSARKLSATNVYHAIQRGINKEIIFHDVKDHEKFLQILYDVKAKSGFELYAYCLMNNHIHLLIKEGEEPLGEVFRRLGSRFVPWYNKKYDRVGHLFQNRYKSEPVETESYFKAVLRYIIQNPLKAGLEQSPGKYRWTSYDDFLKETSGLTDTSFPISLFGSRENLLAYITRPNNDQALDQDIFKISITDRLAQQIFNETTACYSVAEFRRISKQIQKDYLCRLSEKNLTLAQIVRLTGIPKSTVSRIVHSENGKEGQSLFPIGS